MSQQFTVRLPEEILERLRRMAKERERSVNYVLCSILAEWCEENSSR